MGELPISTNISVENRTVMGRFDVTPLSEVVAGGFAAWLHLGRQFFLVSKVLANRNANRAERLVLTGSVAPIMRSYGSFDTAGSICLQQSIVSSIEEK